jgi:hypothetical protein
MYAEALSQSRRDCGRIKVVIWYRREKNAPTVDVDLLKKPLTGINRGVKIVVREFALQ